jgi:hypothetical protein
MLEALEKRRCCGWNCNAKSFIQDKKLKIVWDSKQMPHGSFLLSGKMTILLALFRDRS